MVGGAVVVILQTFLKVMLGGVHQDPDQPSGDDLECPHLANLEVLCDDQAGNLHHDALDDSVLGILQDH